MIYLITGSTHTGKTMMAQRMLERKKIPYVSIDHLKMGLIRGGYTKLTPMDDQELVVYLWPMIREMIKTAIENQQNLIIEGDYIPFDWKKDFDEEYLEQIEYRCLIMSESYIRDYFTRIKGYASVIEKRKDDDWCTMDVLIRENQYHLDMCKQYDLNYYLVDNEFYEKWGGNYV